MIDGCQHTFQHLTNIVLPKYLLDLKQKLNQPHLLSDFVAGKAAILKQLNRTQDFAGCYVLIDKKPMYVGISRGVIGRLRQHITGKSHFDASLAYRMASKHYEHDLIRAEAMKNPAFHAVFSRAQTHLRSLRVAFIEIPCPVEMGLFEIMASMEFDTHQWNTFRTH